MFLRIVVITLDFGSRKGSSILPGTTFYYLLVQVQILMGQLISNYKMSNNRRDNSPLTDEELEPLELRMAELQNLFMNDEITLNELVARTTKYYWEFPWLIIEMELPAKNCTCCWRDSLGNSGYWIANAKMNKEQREEYEKRGIKVYDD